MSKKRLVSRACFEPAKSKAHVIRSQGFKPPRFRLSGQRPAQILNVDESENRNKFGFIWRPAKTNEIQD